MILDSHLFKLGFSYRGRSVKLVPVESFAPVCLFFISIVLDAKCKPQWAFAANAMNLEELDSASWLS